MAGQPADVVALVERYDAWLAASPDVPTLLLAFEAGTPLGSPEAIAGARTHISALDVVELGPAGITQPRTCRTRSLRRSRAG